MGVMSANENSQVVNVLWIAVCQCGLELVAGGMPKAANKVYGIYYLLYYMCKAIPASENFRNHSKR